MSKERLGLLLPALALALSLYGCLKFYVFPPVDVSTEARSPTYLLQIRNDTDRPLVIAPAPGHVGAEPIELAPSQTSDGFPLVVQLLKIGISEATQVVEGTYLQAEGTGRAVLQITTTDPEQPDDPAACSQSVSLSHPSWFASLEDRRTPEPPTLLLCIEDCGDDHLRFGQGPSMDECPN